MPVYFKCTYRQAQQVEYDESKHYKQFPFHGTEATAKIGQSPIHH